MKTLSIIVALGLVILAVAFVAPQEKFTNEPPKGTPTEQNVKPRESLNNPDQQAPSERTVRVGYVIDGDTVELADGRRVRLLGIDSPERGESRYEESKKALEALVMNQDIRVEKDVTDVDKYGRLLRYLYARETFVNLEMVRQGQAKVFIIPPDIKDAALLKNAETEASAAKLGLWAPLAIPTRPSTNISTSFTISACAQTDCDCGNFSSQAEAQWFHNTYDPSDAHRLDSDADGTVCESLP